MLQGMRLSGLAWLQPRHAQQQQQQQQRRQEGQGQFAGSGSTGAQQRQAGANEAAGQPGRGGAAVQQSGQLRRRQQQQQQRQQTCPTQHAAQQRMLALWMGWLFTGGLVGGCCATNPAAVLPPHDGLPCTVQCSFHRAAGAVAPGSCLLLSCQGAVLVAPLLRAHFYCTESEAYRQQVFYYRWVHVDISCGQRPIVLILKKKSIKRQVFYYRWVGAGGCQLFMLAPCFFHMLPADL